MSRADTELAERLRWRDLAASDPWDGEPESEEEVQARARWVRGHRDGYQRRVGAAQRGDRHDPCR